MFEGIIIPVAIGIFVTVVGGLIVLYLWDGHKKKEKLKEKPILNEPTPNKKFLTPSPKRFVSFLGRKNDLQKIETKLQKQNNPILLTVGIGGIGKTELAKEFFFENQKKFNKLAWIKYTNTIADSFCSSFDWFKNTKDIQERYVQIVKKLQQIEGQNLLVIDDISKEDNKITELTSILPNFKIIGTSRLELDRFDIINIDVLEEEDAIKLFSKHYDNISESELEDLKKLLKLIASHTLTIELVAKTSNIKGISIKELLGSLKENGLGFAEDVTTLAYATKDEQATINKILSKIFDISKLEDNEISLLKQLTVLPKNSDIKISFLKQFIEVTDNTDLQKALHNLGQKGWIRKDRETINIHPVIGDTLLKKLNVKFEEIEHVSTAISDTIFDQLAKNPIFAEPYIIYAEAILEIFKEEKNSEIATLLNNLSTIYKALGELNKALEYRLKDLKISEQILDKNHPSLAISYNNLSNIYQALGQLSKALEFCYKALKIREEILDKKHPDLALVYNNLSTIYYNLGKLDKALEYGKKANDIFEQILDKNHPDLAVSYNNLSGVYQDLGELDKALKFCKKALKIQEQILDEPHPYLAASYNNLSLIYKAFGELDKALEYAKRTNYIFEQILDKNHPNLATSYNNMSGVYKALGELDKALEYGKKALKIREQILDKKHPDLAQSYNNLSMIYKNLGEPNKALEFCNKALKIREQILDKNHPDLAQSYNNLAGLYYDLKDKPRALLYINKAIDIRQKIFPNGHPDLDASKRGLEIIKKM